MSDTYTAQAGDTWAGIAFKLWTEETLMHKLIAANALYAPIVVFSGGEVLHVPEIKTSDMKAALPPWRQ